MVETRKRNIAWLAVLAFLLGAQAAGAAVMTRVDRADIELNESFTLEVISDEIIDVQPDISVLEADFYIGQGSQLSNTTIVNGQIQRSKTWTYVLMPRRAGAITIPAISVGSEQSQPLTITVSEPTYAPPGEAEVFVTSEVDFDETYVQAQVLLSVKIYRSVATRQPALRDPTVSGVEVLSELAGDDRSYEAIIDGTAYNVVERVYALYPQESGSIEISPARFEARVLRNGRITGRKVFESEPLSVTILPIPDRPADYPDATWLPAKELQLSEDWSRDIAEVKAGEPLTRRVSVSALGQLETQIPALDPPDTPGINVYPDKPELTRTVEAGGIRGMRSDQYAMIGVAEGPVVLPALEVPWWNTRTGAWEVARLPERTITVLPTVEAPPPLPDPAPEADTAEDAAESAVAAPAAGAASEAVPAAAVQRLGVESPRSGLHGAARRAEARGRRIVHLGSDHLAGAHDQRVHVGAHGDDVAGLDGRVVGDRQCLPVAQHPQDGRMRVGLEQVPDGLADQVRVLDPIGPQVQR